MRLPSKQVLLRMYPTWDVSKQKRMSALISVKHGQAFLRLLRSGSAKTTTSPKQRSQSAARRGKHKLSPGGDDRSRKRFKLDADQVPHGEVSSTMPLMEGGEEKMEEKQVRFTRSTAKLLGNERVPSQSISTLQSGTETGPSSMGTVQKQQYVHPEGSDDGGIHEDESTVVSSLAPLENVGTSGTHVSLSSCESIATNDRESDVTVNVQEQGLALKHKRKSLCPRKILRKMDSGIKASESIPGTLMQEEWLSHAGDSERSTPTDEANILEFSQAQMEPEQELSRCTESPSVRMESSSLVEPEEQPGQLTLLLDQDPMLAEGNFSCSSDQTMVPSSSQGDRDPVSFPGLRFQSIKDDPSRNDGTGNATSGNPSSITGEIFAEVVNSSLIEDTVHGNDLDNLLPGLNLLQEGRAVTVGDPQKSENLSSSEKKRKSRKVKKHKHKSPHKSKKASSARRLDMQDTGDAAVSIESHLVDLEYSPKGKIDKTHKKVKVKEHKHKVHHKGKAHSTSPGNYASNDEISPLPKSPVFGRILPVSSWTGIENPVISPCSVQLVDHLNISQKNTSPREGRVEKAMVQEGASHTPHRFHQADHITTISAEQAIIDDGCLDIEMSGEDADTSKEISITVSTPLPSSRPNAGDKPTEGTIDSNLHGSLTVAEQSSHLNQPDDQRRDVGQCLSTESSSPYPPKEEKSNGQSLVSPDLDGKINTPALEQDQKRRMSGKTKKAVRSRMYSNSPRGAGGWEHSLRQRPSKVTLFQVGSASKTSKKGASPSKVSPKKDTYRRLQQEGHSKVIPRDKSDTATIPTIRPTVTLGDWRKKTPRDVAKPPPLDGKGTDGERGNTSKKIRIKEETEKNGSICRGQLVFGKMKGFCWWPGRIVHHYDRNIRDPPPPLTRWVQWFGDDKYSLLSLGQVVDFEDFPDYFSVSTFQKLSLYQKACYEALNVNSNLPPKTSRPDEVSERECEKLQLINKLAAERAGREFTVAKPTPPAAPGASIKDRQEYKAKMLERFKEMQYWADNRFLPEGSDSIQPSEEEKQIPPVPESPPPSPAREKKRSPIKHGNRTSLEKEHFEDKREERMQELRAGKWTIEEICIGCGSTSLTAKHPLFVGGLCEVCRIEYLEVAYLYDCEGYQAHCCICAEGNQITLCDNQGCYHSYCTVCMDYLVGPQESKKVSEQEPWSCYLCSADRSHGYLTRRDDWQDQLVEFFNHDHVADFEPLQMYKPLLLADRRPIRVLSLFDGLGTGMLVLKDLGFDVECYYASEVSEEAITVAAVRLKGQIKQIGDVQKITPKELKSWGPFDLLIGGSPCNDLANVNPARKGLTGGTGLLFFEFYRILRDLQPLPDDPRPFFWLFENVVSMGRKDKLNICRFLQCNPVMIDSRHVSPTHRARYYWGNLPGMHRPYVAGADNPLCLQECLEPHCDRQAQFSKVGTITTKSNSILQTKNAILPVIMNGKEDGLWSTELERLFGFPDHYTDVGNLSRTARQKLLGKAWSVPVIRHLMAPLKDYFACSGQKE